MKLPATMDTPDIRKLFQLLGKGQVRFVGGCVRNALLGIPVGDIDLATTHPPQDVVRRLKEGGVKVVPTGIDHGTVMAVLNGVGYEITTLRRDVETDGRRAVVAYTTDWAEDASRRDFTINALYADSDGEIYDPLGRGQQDLEKRKVIFVGDAETRIQEDYLRILRFFRFHALVGKGAPDRKSLMACIKFAPKIKTLSRERVTQELTKILLGPSPQKILSVMQGHKILPAILDKSYNPDRIASLIKIQKKAEGAGQDIIFCTRLYGALGFRFKNTTKISSQLILNKKQISILEDLETVKINTKRINNAELQKILYLYDRSSAAAALIIAATKDKISPRTFEKYWRSYQQMEPPKFPVSGNDIIKRSGANGPEIGVALKKLEKRWIKSSFCLPKEELLKTL